jgi:SecD/SecF fusion protein
LIRALAAVLVLAFSAYVALTQSASLGLDLRGGTQITIETQDTGEVEATAENTDKALEVLRQRVDRLGVAESTLARSGENRIVVELPGVDNPDEAAELIGSTAQLSFHKVLGAGTLPLDGQGPLVPPGESPTAPPAGMAAEAAAVVGTAAAAGTAAAVVGTAAAMVPTTTRRSSEFAPAGIADDGQQPDDDPTGQVPARQPTSRPRNRASPVSSQPAVPRARPDSQPRSPRWSWPTRTVRRWSWPVQH